jgi:hypothetical protein
MYLSYTDALCPNCYDLCLSPPEMLYYDEHSVAPYEDLLEAFHTQHSLNEILLW